LYNALSNQGENDVDRLHSLIDNDGFDSGDKGLSKKNYNDMQNVSLQHHSEELCQELASFFGSQMGLGPSLEKYGISFDFEIKLDFYIQLLQIFYMVALYYIGLHQVFRIL
jgi:hypothetical protein